MFGLFKKDKPKEDGDYITTDTNALIEAKTNDIKDRYEQKKENRSYSCFYI